jgi:hypothetical protein
MAWRRRRGFSGAAFMVSSGPCFTGHVTCVRAEASEVWRPRNRARQHVHRVAEGRRQGSTRHRGAPTGGADRDQERARAPECPRAGSASVVQCPAAEEGGRGEAGALGPAPCQAGIKKKGKVFQRASGISAGAASGRLHRRAVDIVM